MPDVAPRRSGASQEQDGEKGKRLEQRKGEEEEERKEEWWRLIYERVSVYADDYQIFRNSRHIFPTLQNAVF